MSTDQATLDDITTPPARERALRGGARYRSDRPAANAPTGNHDRGACDNCGATKADQDHWGTRWWRMFAPRGGPAHCPECMNVHQYFDALANGTKAIEDVQGGQR